MINFLLVYFSVLIKGVLFWKMNNIGTVSYPEVISWSLQLHFVKYHKKEPLSQTLSYCSIRKVSVSNNFLSCFVLIGWKHFELIFIGLTLLLILYMHVISHVNCVMKVGFREQINYMKFMKLCILGLQKQLVKYKGWFCNQIY